MKGKIIKLKNGGVLVYSRSKLNSSTAVEVGFRAGAICDKKPGTAHFLEHSLFKKTKNRTNEEVERDRNKIAFLNASTAMDYLVIKFFRTNKLVLKTMDFAYDVLMNSIIDDEYVETEKGVIKEELKMCLDDEVRDVYLKNYKQATSESRVSSDIVGKTEKNIDSINFNDIQKFKKDYFVGNNFIVSVVSSLPLCKVKKMINKCFVERIPQNVNAKPAKNHFDLIDVDKTTSLKVFKQNQEKVSVLMSFKLNANEFDIFGKNYNYTFLSRFLSGSQGRLFLSLRNKGLIYKLNSDISTFKNTSLFNINFESSKEKIKQILEEIKDEVKMLVNEKVDDDLVKEYQNNLEYLSDEKMPTRMSAVCHVNLMDYLTMGKLFHLTKRQKKALRKDVSSVKIQNAAREIFNKGNEMFVTVLGDVSKTNVPDVNWFKENFLIAE